ncbi:MAG: L,D-transpeptidase family protein [candidate division Zixibacteria bacterium]|nr:L,D-transpeptidase family protein [candidate division Zixibacteria bacterium]NIV07566.1 L,D-transpeptidase family protein [candidate division Zixibacteria bacterium]NIX57782.1 L,D-transpeptidase family protein [candidate division Zixibacteria bacterium]
MEGDKKTPTPRSLVDLELLLTDAFLIYGSHLLSGRINPETIDSEWFANRREADLAEVLQRALNESRIKEALQNLLPPQQNYQLMKTALANYREIESQGKWPGIPDGFKMQKGDQSERVALLRQRLMISGDLDSPASSEPDQFNDDLEQAVRRFQQRHGLDVDGTVGKETVAALNIPVEGRIRQIILNLERWRWLPQELGYRHIIVNIANFELDVFEQNQLTMTMRVIVGRSYRRTPVFSDKMTYLVFNPFWHVPPGIAVRDILPLARKDSLYLSKQKIKVFKGWGGDAAEIDPKTIKWDSVSAKNFPYRFRQDPGPNNALGRVKFMFPNQFNVYLHDTPARELFQKTVRGFSSGCIRIEKPLELAEYVLRGDPKWGREQIIAASDKHLEQTVRLPEPIPVHLLYWTAWVGEDGIIHFRKDIYGRDKPLDEALREAPTGS